MNLSLAHGCPGKHCSTLVDETHGKRTMGVRICLDGQGLGVRWGSQESVLVVCVKGQVMGSFSPRPPDARVLGRRGVCVCVPSSVLEAASDLRRG